MSLAVTDGDKRPSTQVQLVSVLVEGYHVSSLFCRGLRHQNGKAVVQDTGKPAGAHAFGDFIQIVNGTTYLPFTRFDAFDYYENRWSKVSPGGNGSEREGFRRDIEGSDVQYIIRLMDIIQ